MIVAPPTDDDGNLRPLGEMEIEYLVYLQEMWAREMAGVDASEAASALEALERANAAAVRLPADGQSGVPLGERRAGAGVGASRVQRMAPVGTDILALGDRGVRGRRYLPPAAARDLDLSRVKAEEVALLLLPLPFAEGGDNRVWLAAGRGARILQLQADGTFVSHGQELFIADWSRERWELTGRLYLQRVAVEATGKGGAKGAVGRTLRAGGLEGAGEAAGLGDDEFTVRTVIIICPDPCNQGPCCFMNCDDGNACTFDQCENGHCDHLARICCGDIDCDDENACTSDHCVGTGCIHHNVTCNDDGQFCNGDESCNTATGCESSGNPCEPLQCKESTDECVECTADGHCDDGDECTDNLCFDDACVFPPRQCNDWIFCNGEESCDPATGCVPGTPPCPAGMICDEVFDRCVQCLQQVHCEDGDACTIDTCLNTVCHRVQRVCDDGFFCNGAEWCDSAVGCRPGTPPCLGEWQCNEATDTCACYTHSDCGDGNPCTNDWCEGGICRHESLDCNDGYFCNGFETCAPGVGCVSGTPPCGTSQCDEGTDSCLPCSDDAACNDENPCTVDICHVVTGECLHFDLYCDDGDSCTVDTCESDSGCTHRSRCAEYEGYGMCDGVCLCDDYGDHGWVACYDDNPCTFDYCHYDTGECENVVWPPSFELECCHNGVPEPCCQSYDPCCGSSEPCCAESEYGSGLYMYLSALHTEAESCSGVWSGGMLMLNDNDDNGNGVADKDEPEGPTYGEENLRELRVALDGGWSQPGSLTLSCEAGCDRVRFYRRSLRVEPVSLPYVWSLPVNGWNYSGWWWGFRRLYVEGVGGSQAACDVRLKLSHTHGGGTCEETTEITVVRLQVVDAQAFSPNINGGIDDDPAGEVEATWERTGVFADGTSVLVIRLEPNALRTDQDVKFYVTHALYGSGIPFTAQYSGSLSSTFPSLPAPDTGSGVGSTSATVPADAPKIVYYRPPNNFLFGRSKDRQRLKIVAAEVDGGIIAVRYIDLVRPPIIISHGVMSNSTETQYMRNELVIGNPTRYVRPLDWSDINTSGYDDVAVRVKEIIADEVQWRRTQGIAATRVDWVGHSMGSVIVKWYASNMGTFVEPRTGTGFLPINWLGHLHPYLRGDNFGVGDVRRLVSVGSPYVGSPIALRMRQLLSWQTILTIIQLNPGLTGNGNAFNDLGVGSRATFLLYRERPTVSWYPIVCKGAPFRTFEDLDGNWVDVALSSLGYTLTDEWALVMGLTPENSDFVVKNLSQADRDEDLETWPPGNLKYYESGNLVHTQEMGFWGINVSERIKRVLDLEFNHPMEADYVAGYTFFNPWF